ncbi:MAG: ABC transporter ATP-binding protein, partial [Deltaproteobacteria bacterium]
MPVPLLEMKGISKVFGSVKANDNVNLTLYPGDILGLLGENGAGKTTLMNVLFGVYTPDAGVIRINGKQVRIRSSADALNHGIGMVHQHFHLVPCHTVIENLMVGQKGRNGRLDRKTVLDAMAKIRDRFGLALDPDVLVGDLTIGEQQRLEILKALVRGAKVLILDEPTSTLTPQETEGLFDALRAMSGDGMGVIFISHKLHEIQAITNKVVILRRGEVTATLDDTGNVSRHQL